MKGELLMSTNFPNSFGALYAESSRLVRAGAAEDALDLAQRVRADDGLPNDQALLSLLLAGIHCARHDDMAALEELKQSVGRERFWDRRLVVPNPHLRMIVGSPLLGQILTASDASQARANADFVHPPDETIRPAGEPRGLLIVIPGNSTGRGGLAAHWRAAATARFIVRVVSPPVMTTSDGTAGWPTQWSTGVYLVARSCDSLRSGGHEHLPILFAGFGGGSEVAILLARQYGGFVPTGFIAACPTLMRVEQSLASGPRSSGALYGRVLAGVGASATAWATRITRFMSTEGIAGDVIADPSLPDFEIGSLPRAFSARVRAALRTFSWTVAEPQRRP
jgi:hypothetical protein